MVNMVPAARRSRVERWLQRHTWVVELFAWWSFAAQGMFRWIPTFILIALSSLGALLAYANLISSKAKLTIDITDFNNLAAITAFLIWTMGGAANSRSQANTVHDQAQRAASFSSEFLTHAGFRWLLAWSLLFLNRSYSTPDFFGVNPTGLIWIAKELTGLAKTMGLFVIADALWLTSLGLFFFERSYTVSKLEEGRSSQPSS